MSFTNLIASAATAALTLTSLIAAARPLDPPMPDLGGAQTYILPPAIGDSYARKPAPPADAPPIAPEPKWDGDKPVIPEMHQPLAAFPAPTFPQAMLDGIRPAAATALGLFDVNVQEIRTIQQNGESLVALSFPEGQRIARLHPYSMREPAARLQIQVDGGLSIDTAWPQATTYRGTIDGAPDYDVAASMLDGKMSMLILPTDKQLPAWYLQPLSDALPGMPAGLHVLYRNIDVVQKGRMCGVDMEGIPPPPPPVPQPPLAPLWTVPGLVSAPATAPADEKGVLSDDGGIAAANVRCQIALDADNEYYQACGSNLVNTIYEMERMMNYVGLIYQGQEGISYTETFIIIRTSVNDPYNTGLTGAAMRDEFRNYWIATYPGVTRDVAHLFSNRTATDGFIGFAYFAGICNANNGANSGYAWSSNFWATDLASKVGTTAHELGHNWNATHCDGNPGCGIMNSSINGSWTFGGPSSALIIAHRDSRPCLDAWFDPCYVNWAYNGTETGSITQPWNTIVEGLEACLNGGTLNVQAGNYLQNPNIFRAKTIHALNGTVRIGN